MATFTDASGRQWSLHLDFQQIVRIGKELGVRLDKVFDDGMKPLGALLQDLEKFIGVLWLLIEEQAAHGPSAAFRWYKPWTWFLRGMSPEEFGRSLDGEALQRAEAAFWEALTDFFPHQKARLNRLRAKILELSAEEQNQGMAKVEALTLEEVHRLEANGQAQPAKRY